MKNYFTSTSTNILQNEELREPQIEAYVKVFEHFIEKKKTTHAFLVLPTGSGKTGLISILPYNIANGRVLVIAPQLTILDTIESSLDSGSSKNFWIEKNIIKNPKDLPVVVKFEGKETLREHMESADIVISNIQKLQSRNEMSLLNQYDPDFFDMIIIDEAHHSEARTWIENLQHFSKAKVIKITATAYRTDNKQLVGDLIYKYKLSQAMSKGYVKSLEKFNYIPQELYFTLDNNLDKTYTFDQIMELNLKDEDWIARSVAFSDECKKSVVKKSLEILEQKRKNTDVPHKIIAAASNIDEAKKIEMMYNEQGYRAIAVHNRLSIVEKEKAFLDIENNRVDVVVNVSMMGEGYDHKYLSVAAIFRAFKSPLPYEQFIGRILRSIPRNEIKKPEDNVGSVVAHELLFLDQLWDYYKEQIQESDFISELGNLELIEECEESPKEGKIVEVDFGSVKEKGEGSLSREIYLETEYMINAEKSRLEREQKIKDISEILGITDSEASNIVDAQNSEYSEIKRPDILRKVRKQTTDGNIKEVIVPELLSLAGADIKGNDLSKLPIFKGKYAWIPKKTPTNGGMLARYFNFYLKNEIGYGRENWNNEDFERANKLLEQQAGYIKEFLKGAD